MSKTQLILIGGASGTSKTSTSNELSFKYGIAHRLGSGFIREMSKCFIKESDCPSLYRYSFAPVEGMTPFDNLYEQSKVIEPMVWLAIKRASQEGYCVITIIKGSILLEWILLRLRLKS